MSDNKNLFLQLKNLSTEERNPASLSIDSKSIEEVLSIINNEDKLVALAVEKEIPFIAQAVKLVVDSFRLNGRLLYFGAGTSGRLGVLDAVECPPTFGVSHNLVQGFIAGGEAAMFRAQEGAEDKEENGFRDVVEQKINSNDVVCGIAASMRTPYVVGVLKKAKELGAKTIFVTTNPRSILYSEEYNYLSKNIDVAICPEVKAEVVMGSTRMKSGTAQKLILNMITTTAFIQMGKIYENMMIDLQLTNEKLRERAKRVLMIATNVSYDEAEKFLLAAHNHVKSAIVMIKSNVDYGEAQARLQKSGGFVREAIENKVRVK